MTASSEQVERQAAQRLIQLEANGSPDHHTRLEVWLSADSRHRAAFLRLSLAWSRADQLAFLRPSSITADANAPDRSSRLARTVHHGLQGRLFMLATAAVTLSCLFLNPGQSQRIRRSPISTDDHVVSPLRATDRRASTPNGKSAGPRLSRTRGIRDRTVVTAGELDTQALNWLVRSEAPDCTNAERVQLEAWLESPRNRAAYLRMRVIWSQTDQLRRLQPLDGKVDPDLLGPGSTSISGGEPPKHAVRGRPAVAYIVAGLLLTVIVSGVTAWIVSETLLRAASPP